MRLSNSSQATDFVGLFLLAQIKRSYPSLSSGLNKNEALFVVHDSSNSQAERINILFENSVKSQILGCFFKSKHEKLLSI